MGLKVAIVGLAGDCRDSVPWSDPAWELWGLPWDAEGWPRLHRTFEMHDDLTPDAAYSERLQSCARLYTQANYPVAEVAQTTGGVFESSVAYMLALAIHEGAEEIGIWGVTMEGNDEYAYQRPNCEYLIGLARGRGIKVFVHERSSLCKYGRKFPIYPERYGAVG